MRDSVSQLDEITRIINTDAITMNSDFTLINCDVRKDSHLAMMKMGFKTLNALTAGTLYHIGTLKSGLHPQATMYSSGYSTTADNFSVLVGGDGKVSIVPRAAIGANRNLYCACPAYFIA